MDNNPQSSAGCLTLVHITCVGTSQGRGLSSPPASTIFVAAPPPTPTPNLPSLAGQPIDCLDWCRRHGNAAYPSRLEISHHSPRRRHFKVIPRAAPVFILEIRNMVWKMLSPCYSWINTVGCPDKAEATQNKPAGIDSHLPAFSAWWSGAGLRARKRNSPNASSSMLGPKGELIGGCLWPSR